MIFVFGSNLSGIHGAGAARYAITHHGARWGQGWGLQGNSYAIPTKDHDVKTSLALETVKMWVNEFIDFATERPDLYFEVTRIGCGLAGFKDEDIAPMFRDAPQNCAFDTQWEPILGNQVKYWGIYLG
jgi:hypothetical protein